MGAKRDGCVLCRVRVDFEDDPVYGGVEGLVLRYGNMRAMSITVKFSIVHYTPGSVSHYIVSSLKVLDIKVWLVSCIHAIANVKIVSLYPIIPSFIPQNQTMLEALPRHGIHYRATARLHQIT